MGKYKKKKPPKNRKRTKSPRDSIRLSREEKVVAALHGPESKLSWFIENRGGIGYDFWVVHGVNYLSSLYSDGLWDPIAPEIYHGGTINSEKLYARIMNRYMDSTLNRLSPTGIHCFMWLALKPHEMYPLVWKIKWKAKEYGGEPLKEGDGHTWYLFESLKPLMEVACSQWEKLSNVSTPNHVVMDKIVSSIVVAPLPEVEEGLTDKRSSKSLP